MWFLPSNYVITYYGENGRSYPLMIKAKVELKLFKTKLYRHHRSIKPYRFIILLVYSPDFSSKYHLIVLSSKLHHANLPKLFSTALLGSIDNLYSLTAKLTTLCVCLYSSLHIFIGYKLLHKNSLDTHDATELKRTYCHVFPGHR